jgi:predicted metal-binding transcription factor (methanogenesis marker protein 9)
MADGLAWCCKLQTMHAPCTMRMRMMNDREIMRLPRLLLEFWLGLGYFRDW